MKVALVHDWLTGMRGGEKVLEALCEIFPAADLFTLVHVKGSVSALIEDRRIRTSFIQSLPFSGKRYRHYLPLFPAAIESFDLSGYGLVISSSHCVAKGAIAPPGALHLSYVHTPMRYVWDMYGEYFGSWRGVKGAAARLVAHYLRLWDAATANRVDGFIANSAHVARRIERCYGRDSEVIHPPVDCRTFKPGARAGGPYLVVSAFAPYKRLDIAIEAFNALGKRLVVIGTGQEEARLRRMAGPNIEFLGWVGGAELAAYYSSCRALVFPGEEDFGITPLEAMASGRPVIALGRGGALETVVPPGRGKAPTGVLFAEQTPEALCEAVSLFERMEGIFDSRAISAHATAFDKEVFKSRMARYVDGRLGALDARRAYA